MPNINYQAIRMHYASDHVTALRLLLPGGRVAGNDYIVANPRRNDRTAGSFRIDIATLRFHDFATGDRGVGVIDLAAYVWNLNIETAAERLYDLRASFLPAGNSFSTSNNFNENKGLAKKKEGEVSEPSPAELQRFGFIWNKSRPLNDHEYLRLKHIGIGNARINVYKGVKSLVIPLTDSIPTSEKDLQIKALQYILEDGSKIFSGKCGGLFHVASSYDEDKIVVVICEGFADAMSIAPTGHYTISAMGCGNMKSVALRVHGLLPDAGVVLATDADEAGRKAAEETEKALRALGGNVHIIYPTPSCKDFNDMLVGVGSDELKKYVKALVVSFLDGK